MLTFCVIYLVDFLRAIVRGFFARVFGCFLFFVGLFFIRSVLFSLGFATHNVGYGGNILYVLMLNCSESVIVVVMVLLKYYPSP